MLWIILIAIYLLTDSSAMFIDNYVSDVYFKGRLSTAQKVFSGWIYLLFAIIVILAVGINLNETSILTLFLVTLTGIIASVGSIAYYRALELDDSTDVSIFFQLSPIFYLVFGWFLLGERFSPLQFVAFAMILMGPLLIIMGSRKNSRKAKMRTVALVSLYVLIYTISNILFVKINTGSTIDFRIAMACVFLGKGIGNLILCYIIRPKWAKRWRHVVKSSKGKVYFPLTIDLIFCLVKDVTYRLALLTAPAVAIASAASDSIEPVVVLVMGVLLTLISPKLGREKLDRKSLISRLVATACVVVGIVVLQI
ncbi:DMT family transporter [Candidatus Saccharibacteria bacterium]|nr:DMT family transporter [Candidatus Saccharibacteria bacterium]